MSDDAEVYIEIYKRLGRYRWRAKSAGNHEILAQGQGYKTMQGLKKGLKAVWGDQPYVLDDKTYIRSAVRIELRDTIKPS